MKRKDLSRLEATVREANPVPQPSDLVDSDESAAVVLLVSQGRRTMTTTLSPQPPPTEPRPSLTRRWVWAFAAALIATVLVVGLVALLQPGSDSPVIDQATTSMATPSTTMTSTTGTSAVPTTVPAAPAVLPSLGEGWDIVLSTRPGDSPLLAGASVSITDAGYYIETFDDDGYGRYLIRRDGKDGTLVDIGVPGSGGFVTAGTGVVAWANVGPESRTEAQLWMSSDGVKFERVADDLFAGCAGKSNCRGTEIYAAAGAPSGRVVALAYDPLVWKPECDCFELNPVALVSDDGREWTREPLDLLSVLPAEWQGAADIRSPLVYVEGRWLTYATRYYNNGYTTDTAFFASENGIDWQLIDTGDLFDETFLLGIAANDRGVVALTREVAYWSVDGSDWTRTTLTDRDDALKVAAYDDGYVVVSAPRVPESAARDDTIWYSADGITWSRTSLHLEEPTRWNAIIGDGSNLVAIGGTETNLNGIWRWSG